MTRWEYARLQSTGEGVDVVFTHRPAWARQGPELFFDTLRRMGDDGWELVSAMPLAWKHPPGDTYVTEPDRWLLFKRPLPEAPATQEMKGEDVLKGIVGRQLLKGRIPLP
ncbi:MAG: hypothetical protein ACR2NO_04065 [Chloroflexota bacterium]